MFLSRCWGLVFKPDSRQILLPKDQPCDTFVSAECMSKWPVKAPFPCLGHRLSRDGSTLACRQATIRACWSSFWANIMRPVKTFQNRRKLVSRINIFVTPILRFRMARWPYVVSQAKALDHVQRQMIQIALNLRPVLGETQEAFCRRKNRETTFHQTRHVAWSSFWAKAVGDWGKHVRRNTNGSVWSASLLELRSSEELAQRRSQFNNRPHTRRFSGFNPRRWEDGFDIVCAST